LLKHIKVKYNKIKYSDAGIAFSDSVSISLVPDKCKESTENGKNKK